jgi:cellulose synthase/poly-beta-1,6-N-acetylglucosamine synthase-like glycosyltransferase
MYLIGFLSISYKALFGAGRAWIEPRLVVLGNVQTLPRRTPVPDKKIIMVASLDDTYRKPLLETAGYQVRLEPTLLDASRAMAKERYDLVLIVNDGNTEEVAAFCREAKSSLPNIRTALLARWAENIPQDTPVDVVIRTHQHPGKFLADIKTLVNS